MRLTRRRFISTLAASGLVSGLLPGRLWSATSLDLGGSELLTLSDGHLELPPEFILGDMSPSELAAFMAAHDLPDGPLISPCNVTLLRDGTNNVLFDVGAGPDFMSTAGRLGEALDIAGVAPEEVTHVIFTHGHPDHLWGLLDEFDEPRFAEAEMFMGGTEFDYWTDPATVESIDPGRTTFAVGAKRRLEMVADMIARLAPGDSPVPGITARLLPGHTPGHMGFDLGEVLLVGDAIGNPHIAFERPGFHTRSDQDAEMAAETRLALMAELAGSGQGIVGFHLPEGGIGKVVAEGEGYRFEA